MSDIFALFGKKVVENDADGPVTAAVSGASSGKVPGALIHQEEMHEKIPVPSTGTFCYAKV